MLPKQFPDREEIATVRTEAAELEPGAEVEVETPKPNRDHSLFGMGT